MDLARIAGDRCYDPVTNRCLISRDTFWYAISLLFDEKEERRQFGRQLFRTVEVEDCTHTPATLLAALYEIPELLDGDLCSQLDKAVHASLNDAALVQLNDGNVNHPLAAFATLILGGERSDQPWAVDIGRRRLEIFRERIGDHRGRHRRQAEMSEYNSLTYTALDLWFLALVAEHARSKEARRIALFLEQRLWVDVAMHFHAPSQQFAGPHSRSYQEDSLGGFSGLHCTMLAAFDDPLFLHPSLCERFDHPSALLQNSLAAILTYHVPEEARSIAWKKPFPFEFRKTTYGESYHENSKRAAVKGEEAKNPRFAFDDERYPGGWSDLAAYMTKEYALGSAALPYVNAGHSDCVMVRIRRSERIGSMADIRSIYTRGVFNNAKVGERNISHVSRTPIDRSFLCEEGRSSIYQHKNAAIVCYCPKRAGHAGVTSFRLDLIFGFHAPFDELLVNGQSVDTLPLSVGSRSVICFRDFRTYGLVRPLIPFPKISDRPVRFWQHGEFLVMSMINYEGPPLDITRHGINAWRTGFVLELGTAQEESWEDFVRRAEKSEVTEEVENGIIRTARYTSRDGTMELSYDPYKEVILSRRWNGTEEGVLHFEVEAAGSREGPYCPETLYGREALPW